MREVHIGVFGHRLRQRIFIDILDTDTSIVTEPSLLRCSLNVDLGFPHPMDADLPAAHDLLGSFFGFAFEAFVGIDR
jgi:hypothetical protein